MAVEGDGGWWWDKVDTVVVVVGLRVCKCEAGGAGGQNYKTEPYWLGFGLLLSSKL
jgi:hypothetical protein